MKAIINILNDFLNLIFPKLCVICDETLVLNEKFFCTHCLYDLPLTRYESLTDNEMSQVFWGRATIQGTYSLFYFIKKSKYSVLLHKLKYKGEQGIGIELGKMLGSKLLNTEMAEADLILPLPLHPKKKLKRGYNQSECIAQGISMLMNLPVETNAVIRNVYTITQTGKGRYERWENVKGIFSVKESAALHGKKIILVDDIVTTGSTLEACVMAIHETVDCTIYICSVAFTRI